MTLDANGAVSDRFAASVSVINGGIECSPIDPKKEEAIEKSKNRFRYFLVLLNLFGGTKTPVEQTYVAGKTYCTIDRGNVWVSPYLACQPKQYLNYDGAGAEKCKAIGYQATVVVPVSGPGIFGVCTNL